MELATTNVTKTNDGTKYSNTGLAPATTRHYRVSAVNIAGRGPVSAAINGATTLEGVPAAPTGLKAKAVGVAGEDVVELYWTAPSAGRAPITHYRIETSTDDGATWAESIADTEGSGADNEVSTVVETYYAVDATATENFYRVSAANIIGTGLVSATVTVTPPVAGTQPSEPEDVAALADGSREIEVTWGAPPHPRRRPGHPIQD